MKLCKCGCNISLRKDNKTGFQKGHGPINNCPSCGDLFIGSSECCSKSCSAKLHWKKNPEMKENRIWNKTRYETREKNRDQWIKNLSKARQGKDPWNKGLSGKQIPWNKDLPREQQPYYGKKHNKEYFEKRDRTVFEKYGIKYTTELAKISSRSKIEKQFGKNLTGYSENSKVGKYKPDYINEETKHIIEIYGDYWHCNPKMFDPNFYHSQLKMTAKEKWKKDNERISELEKLGYTVTIIWESEIKRNNDHKKKHKEPL